MCSSCKRRKLEEAGAAPAWVQVVQLNKAGRDPEAEGLMAWSMASPVRHTAGWNPWAGRTIRAACTAPGATRFKSQGEPGTEGQALEKKMLEILPRNLLTIGEKPTPAESPVDLTRPIPAKHILPIPEGTPVDVRFRLEALRQLYDTARNLLKLEAEGADDGPVEAIRGELDRIDDRFVAGFGPIGLRSTPSSWVATRLLLSCGRWKAGATAGKRKRRPSSPAGRCGRAG